MPRGSHGIPADVIARNQRERLVAAMAEVCAEVGYAGASVAAVAKRAGVSSLTFYQLFAGKRECILAAHRHLLGRLLEEVDRARAAAADPEEAPRAALRAALALLAADAPSARLLTVEVLAAGPEGVERHEAAVDALARRLRVGGRDPAGAEPGPPADTDRAAAAAPLPVSEWVSVAGLLALVGRLVVAGEADRLPQLEQQLWPLAPGATA